MRPVATELFSMIVTWLAIGEDPLGRYFTFDTWREVTVGCFISSSHPLTGQVGGTVREGGIERYEEFRYLVWGVGVG